MREPRRPVWRAAFTLIELLLTMTIILLLLSLLMPAISRSRQKVKIIECTSNQHQTGLGFLAFANGHEDKFPVQVSTNSGGSAEFVQAGYAVQGPFYFSYKHFLPLAGEIDTPKLLVCPTDMRSAATNFSSLNNSNLSYFTSINPQYLNPDSILEGDRNLAVSSNTIARIGPRRSLRWTGEMHQYRGNVLFADGHVEQLRDVVSVNNRPGASLASVVLPSVPAPAPAPVPSLGGGGGGSGGDGNLSLPGGKLTTSFSNTNNNFLLTNGAVITNLQITSGPRNTPRSAFVHPAPGGIHPLPETVFPSNSPAVAVAPPATPAPLEPADEDMVNEAHQNLVQSGRDFGNHGSRFLYRLPWWLVVPLLLLALWLLKRAHDRSSQSARPKSKRPEFFAGRHS